MKEENNKKDIHVLPLDKEIEVECIEGMLDLDADFEEYLDEEYIKSANQAYAYSYGNMSKEEREEYEAWWGGFLHMMDRNYEDYYDDYGYEHDYGYYDNDDGPCYESLDEYEDDLPFGEQVFPPKEERVRKNPFKRNSGVNIKPQRFVNGIEVNDDDDDFFDAFSGGRRSKKHKKNRHHHGKTYRHRQDKEIEEANHTDYNVEGADDIKKIVFYRTLANESDTYEWDSVFEFNEWLQENSIYIKDCDVTYILNNDEIHCCLDPTTSDKVLITDRSYGDLVWNLTGADVDLIKEYSQRNWNV